MIARKFAYDQIDRLKVLAGFPNDEGRETLVDMLETAPTPAAARTFVTCWLQDEPQMPTPNRIYRYFHPTKDAEQTTSAPLAASKNCPFCNGTGWSIITAENGATAAKPCRCRQQMSLAEVE